MEYGLNFRVSIIFIGIFFLQSCYMNASISGLNQNSTGLSPIDQEKPTSVQVSSANVTLQEQDVDVLYDSEINLTLNQKYSKPITVNLTLVDIYTQNTVDYSIDNLSFVITPGELSKSIPILIKGDALGEGTETFKIQISLSDSEVLLSANEILVTITDNDPIVLQVASLYPNSGPNFLDYVENQKTTPLDQVTDQSCSYPVASKYDDCIDGGYYRKVIAIGEHSCENLTLEDNLGIFDWICSTSADPVFFYSSEMKSTKGLKDILEAAAFKDNFVTLKKNSTTVATSAPAAWWTNTVSPLTLNSGGADPRITLSSAGTIYTINTSGTSRGITLTAKVGLVVRSGSLTSTNPASGDCDASVGGTQQCLILFTTGSSYSKVEGSFAGTSNLASAILLNSGSSISSVVINNTTVLGVGIGNGIYVSGTSTPGMTLSNSIVNGFSINVYYSGLGGQYKLLKNLTISNAVSHGLNESGNSWYSKYIDIVTVNNGGTGFTVVPLYSHIQNITVSNNGNGITDSSNSTNYFNVLVTGQSGFGLYTSLFGGFARNITSVNNTGSGIILSPSGPANRLANVLSANNNKGLDVGSGSNLSVSNLWVSNNTTGIDFTSSSTGSSFQNSLVLGGNGTNCTYTLAGASPGLSGVDCANQGASTAVRTLNMSAIGAFQGKVVSDTFNIHTTGLSIASSITQWFGFENSFRAWGLETAGDVLVGAKGRCTGGASCRIWDWRLLNTATAAFNVNGVFTNGTSCPPSIQGDVTDLYLTVPHLINAVEILFDRKGNDNGLCESNEECIYSPHIGYYQGEGDYRNNTCVFANGSASNPVVGVKMYSYPNPL